MDIIIPALIMTGFVAVIAYSTIKDRHRKQHKEDPNEQPPKYAHPPMDLRMKNYLYDFQLEAPDGTSSYTMEE